MEKHVGKRWEKFRKIVEKAKLEQNGGKSWSFARGGGKVLQADLHMSKQIVEGCFPHFPHGLLLLLLNL